MFRNYRFFCPSVYSFGNCALSVRKEHIKKEVGAYKGMLVGAYKGMLLLYFLTYFPVDAD